MKIGLIVNPISGTHDKRIILAVVRRMLSDAGNDVQVMPTQYPGHAIELAKEAVSKSYDLVLAMGGDGTVNEVATGMCHTDVPMGIIPAGSGNGLARHLNIPLDVRGAVKTILTSQPLSIDAGVMNGRMFFCTCGVGFDAEVSHDFAAQPTRGKLQYINSTYRVFRRYKPKEYEITIDGVTTHEKALSITLCNATQYGNNAYIAPRAAIDDGKLDVVFIHQGDTLSTLKVSVDLLAGLCWRNGLVTHTQGKEIIIEQLGEAAAHIDGEPVMMPARIEISCQEGALKVLAHKANPHIIPVLSQAQGMITDITAGVHNKFK